MTINYFDYWKAQIPLSNPDSQPNHVWLVCPFCTFGNKKVKLINWNRHLYKCHDIDGKSDKIAYSKMKYDLLKDFKRRFIGSICQLKISTRTCLILDVYHKTHFEIFIDYLIDGQIKTCKFRDFAGIFKIDLHKLGEKNEKHLGFN